MIHLVLGGARSGKSSYAESCILSQIENKPPIYIATATSLDDEMEQRIQHHQEQRSSHHWQLIESPLKLCETLQAIDSHQYVLVDCLTLWLTNHLMLIEEQNTSQSTHDYLTEQVDLLISSLNNHSAYIVLVSNEIGLGVVPMGEQTRLFVDHVGWLNQKLAKAADKVTLVTAGLPMVLKDIACEEKPLG